MVEGLYQITPEGSEDFVFKTVDQGLRAVSTNKFIWPGSWSSPARRPVLYFW